jgi:hypothetical protein
MSCIKMSHNDKLYRFVYHRGILDGYLALEQSNLTFMSHCFGSTLLLVAVGMRPSLYSSAIGKISAV